MTRNLQVELQTTAPGRGCSSEHSCLHRQVVQMSMKAIGVIRNYAIEMKRVSMK